MKVNLISSPNVDDEYGFNSTSAECCWILSNPVVPMGTVGQYD